MANVRVEHLQPSVAAALFKTPFRDVSCGLKLIRRDVVNELDLRSTSPFIGAEISIKTHLKGLRVGEVGIQTFPRQFGGGSATSVKNILATIRDMRLIHNEVFSPEYDQPMTRRRATGSTARQHAADQYEKLPVRADPDRRLRNRHRNQLGVADRRRTAAARGDPILVGEGIV